MKFRKKPVVVDAITFEELAVFDRASWPKIDNDMPLSFPYQGHTISRESSDYYLIYTLEGAMKMGRTDMLITGVHGEIYPCKADIFAKTYDPESERQELTTADVDDGGVLSRLLQPTTAASTEAELEAQLLKSSAAPRITPADIDAAIAEATYHRFPGTTVTVCCLTLRNGFNVVGQSACASVENFDAAVGQSIAFANAREKLWELEGYLLKDRLAHGAWISGTVEETSAS